MSRELQNSASVAVERIDSISVFAAESRHRELFSKLCETFKWTRDFGQVHSLASDRTCLVARFFDSAVSFAVSYTWKIRRVLTICHLASNLMPSEIVIIGSRQVVKYVTKMQTFPSCIFSRRQTTVYEASISRSNGLIYFSPALLYFREAGRSQISSRSPDVARKCTGVICPKKRNVELKHGVFLQQM